MKNKPSIRPKYEELCLCAGPHASGRWYNFHRNKKRLQACTLCGNLMYTLAQRLLAMQEHDAALSPYSGRAA